MHLQAPPRSFAGTMLIWASVVIIVAGLKASASLVVPLLLALFLAILCGPPLEWLIQRGLRRGLAMLLVIGGLCVVVLIVAQLLAAIAASFIERWPEEYQPRTEEIAAHWREWIEDQTQAWIRRLDPEHDAAEPVGDERPATAADERSLDDDQRPPAVDEPLSGSRPPTDDQTRGAWNDWLEPDFLMRSFTIGMRAVSGILSQAVLILVMTIFLLVEATMLPEKLQHIAHEVNHYMAIKTATSLLTGGFVALALWLLDVDFALLWGMTAFALNYVPNIGSIIAAVPAILLALLQHGFGTAVAAAGVYLAVNMFIGYYLEPKWMGRGLGLSTLVVFGSLVFWGWVLGPVGMVISVPLTMAVKIALEGYEDTRWLAILMGQGGESLTTKA